MILNENLLYLYFLEEIMNFWTFTFEHLHLNIYIIWTLFERT